MATALKDATSTAGADPAEAPLDTATNTLAGLDKSNLSPDQQAQLGRVQGQIEGQKEKKPESLKISISLDLDVEVHLTARIKGDIVIGLL